MSAEERLKVVAEVERQGRGKSRRLRELGISRSTYYWWRHRQGSWEGTEEIDRPWNRLRPDEAAVVLAAAREMPTWRSRQLAGELFLEFHRFKQHLCHPYTTVAPAHERRGAVEGRG